MNQDALEVQPCSKKCHVLSQNGEMWPIPEGWQLFPPGDPALSRRIKKSGPSWTVKEKKGTKVFSHGIWAPAEHLAKLKAELEVERAQPSYEKKLRASQLRRQKEQANYVIEFDDAVAKFLSFAKRHKSCESKMTQLIVRHATPVGSGTVARTKRISIEKRAEAATVAWMRHQTTAYDDMSIPHEKAARRNVRRQLAQESKQLLSLYRSGADISIKCPLQRAITSS